MCGIVGFCDFTKRLDSPTLRQMTEVLHHRGPDDTGYYFKKNDSFHVGLGHKRLSIIDISSAGHQPMQFHNLVLIYNGEIYNYDEIREELVKDGYTFTSSSDTEVVLKAFHYWGEDAIAKFNGMFAIALYNQDTEELLLARDRMGVKPLFYYYDGHNIVFSSELKSILKYPGVNKEIDLHSLYTYLFHGYITSPKSIFKNVYKLNPGNYLKYKNRQIEHFTYWNLIEQFHQESKSLIHNEEQALGELDKIITESVQYRMIADVPLGSFLSGGYDSSLVTAVMQKLSNQPIKTFTIGFKEKEFNEAEYAKRVADYLKTDHYEQYLSIEQAKELITKLPKHFDEPFSDRSMLPTMLVSKFARQHVTVALTGDGGDELFCGYSRYDRIAKYEKTRALGILSNWIASIPLIKDKLSVAGKGLNKLPYLGKLNSIINIDYLLSRYYLDGLVLMKSFSVENQYLQISEDITNNLQEGHMLLDMLTYLPDDIMAKVDRASMSVSLESREPLLDYRLVEFSFRLAHQLKCNNGAKKYLLKKLAHQYLPRELLDRKKMGFGLPIYDWLRKDLSYLIDNYLGNDRIENEKIFDPHRVRNLLSRFKAGQGESRNAILIWRLLIFQIWYEYYY